MIRLALLVLSACSTPSGGGSLGECVLPVEGYSPRDGCLEFGGVNHNFTGLHVGDDYCAPSGTEVQAISDGVVAVVTTRGTVSDNWGPIVLVDHPSVNGAPVCAIYGHVVGTVPPGTVVAAGDTLATIYDGSEVASWWSDHVHFGVYGGSCSELPCTSASCAARGYLDESLWPGSYVDPYTYVAAGCALDSDTVGDTAYVEPVDTAAPNPECACADADGDGWYAEGCDDSACDGARQDCEDTDRHVYPGATELTDYVDNDCDGQVDEDFRVRLSRAFWSNGLACNNSAADFDHCLSEDGGTCLGGQGGGSGWVADGVAFTAYAGSISDSPTVRVGAITLAGLYACYRADATEHYYLPAGHPDLEPDGYTCTTTPVAYVRTDWPDDPSNVAVYYGYAPALSDRMFGTASGEGESCGYAAQGVIWWGW
jgi:hypothetical protein